MPFELFDPHQDFRVVWRHLPHWEQPGATSFITWRTIDSMPRAVLLEWMAERDAWLAKRGLSQSAVGSSATTRLPPAPRADFRAFLTERWECRGRGADGRLAEA